MLTNRLQVAGVIQGPQGDPGKSAYQHAVDNGFVGSEQEWLASLKGEPGEKGDTGQKGDQGEPGQNGQDGATGPKGDTGKSAYQIAVDGGFKGSEQEWLASLKGEKGDPGQDGAPGKDGAIGPKGDQGEPGQNGQDGATGPKGDPGKSAYDYAVEGGYQGTEEEFAESVAGEYSDAITNTATGDLLVIKDSSDRKVKSFEMTGKTEQVQTSGYQLFDASKIQTKTQGGATVTNNGDGSFTISGTGSLTDDFSLYYKYTNEEFKKLVKAGNIYFKTLKGSAPYIYLQILNGDSVVGDLSTNKFEITKEMIDNSAYSIRIGFYGNRGTNIISNVVKPMFYQDGDGTWEPYTGGKPSPSPEYPQEIVSAGRLNKETGKYEVDVNITGKNLIPFPYTAISGNKGTKNGITWEVLTDGGIMLNGTANPKTFYLDLHDNLKIGNTLIPPGGTDGRIATNKDVSYNGTITKAYIAVNKGVTVNRVYYPQVEIGTVATAYESYREPQTITLALDRPLTKWDRLEKREGVWGIVRQGETKVLKAAPEEEWAAWEDKQNAFFIRNDKIIKEGLCSHFESKGSFEIGKETGIYLSETIHLIVTDMNINSLENWKTWLQANPITVTYKTAEEIWEPLPEETQKALNELHTNYPTTVVANSENAYMELSYTADTKNYVDGKIKDSISAQIQNTANLLSLMPDDVQAAMIENDTNRILESEVVE